MLTRLLTKSENIVLSIVVIKIMARWSGRCQEIRVHGCIWVQNFASLGKALSECFYYLIQWDFDANSNPVLVTLNPEPIPTAVTSSTTGEAVQIAQLRCDESHKKLGVS
jgi:hypothetical protein